MVFCSPKTLPDHTSKQGHERDEIPISLTSTIGQFESLRVASLERVETRKADSPATTSSLVSCVPMAGGSSASRLVCVCVSDVVVVFRVGGLSRCVARASCRLFEPTTTSQPRLV